MFYAQTRALYSPFELPRFQLETRHFYLVTPHLQFETYHYLLHRSSPRNSLNWIIIDLILFLSAYPKAAILQYALLFW